ncbi:hydroxycinnamoyltransferase-like [Lolium rigidum]|uniref:hydroxycinnamoyltransferase-like n=1 Tax=Lolium rigidum TaxID=89674 RepID=UPI001F5C2DC9|nr:hydroxycinnamoyltransferase-like [Lolium rigidum]
MAKDDSASGVRVMSRSMVKASVRRPRVVLPVSNLDLLFQDTPASMLCLYRKPSSSSGDFEDVVAGFKAKLPSLLDHFYPLAGRIVADPRSGLPEIHCDNQGLEVIVGEVGEALGSLHYGDLAASLARIGIPVQYSADAILTLQLVSFACGGFAVAWAGSHMALDGSAICTIANAWSDLAAGCSGTISAAPPNYDRSVFRPRAPPAYNSSIGELYALLDSKHLVNALTAGASFVGRTYYVEERDLVMLRAQAGGPRTSRVEAVSAYLWKVFASVVGSSDETCRMAWWVNGRRHLTTTAPAEAMRNYIGNVTSYAVAEASVEGVKRRPLQGIASMMRESIKSTATDEHFQQVVDWVEDHKGKDKQGTAAKYVEAAAIGLGSPLLGVTSFASFPFNTDFGFGQAAYAMPAWVDSGRLCFGFVIITTSPGGSSLFFSMSIWPSLAAALDSDEQRIFKPLTAEYLGLAKNSRL